VRAPRSAVPAVRSSTSCDGPFGVWRFGVRCSVYSAGLPVVASEPGQRLGSTGDEVHAGSPAVVPGSARVTARSLGSVVTTRRPWRPPPVRRRKASLARVGRALFVLTLEEPDSYRKKAPNAPEREGKTSRGYHRVTSPEEFCGGRMPWRV
jgi:hypothetical protein